VRPLSCLRQIAITLALMLGWYALLRAPVALLYPNDPEAPIDTCVANTPLAGESPNIVLYEIDRLERPAERRMVVLGSSNAMLSLRPEDLKAKLPGWQIVNLSIPTSNVHQAFQVVTLATAISDRRTLENTVFVLGTYPGLYARAKSLWHKDSSPLAREMLRYGLYRAESDEEDPTPIFGYRLAWLTKDFYRTFLAAKNLGAAFDANAELVGQGKSPNLEPFRGARSEPCHFRTKPASAKRRAMDIRKRARQIGTHSRLEDEQFEELAKLALTVRSSGARLVITEMTVPEWMRLEHFEFYRNQKQSFIRDLAHDPGVFYLDLKDVVPDVFMGDSTHPTRAGAQMYAEVFCKRLRTLRDPIFRN
jgi:hypothetical protein